MWFSVDLPSAVPATFSGRLKSQEGEEGGSVALRCELSKKGASVQWWRGDRLLSEEVSRIKYQMSVEGRVAQMTILDLHPGDTGKYSCTVGDEKTNAEVTVKRTFKITSLVACIWFSIPKVGFSYFRRKII